MTHFRLGRPWLVLLPITLCVIILIFGILRSAAAIELFINSDSLLPVHMAWEVLRHDYALANFQWPRVPSLPDVIFFFAADLIGMNWRWAILLYTCLVAAALILTMGKVVSRLRCVPFWDGVFWAGIAVVAALAFAAAALARVPADAIAWMPQLYLFVATSHGNAFVISLLACCTGIGALRGNRRQAKLTWACCVIGTFSDTIFIANFVVPFLLATVIVASRYRYWQTTVPSAAAPDAPTIFRFGIKTVLACSVGWALKMPLLIQHMDLIFPGPYTSVANLSRDLQEAPWIIGLIALSALLSLRSLFVLGRRPGAEAPSDAIVLREWLVLTGLGATVLSFGIAALLYDVAYAYRYAIPFFWWPLALAAGLIRLPSARWIYPATAGAAVLVTLALPLGASSLPHWRSELERCLSGHRAEWALKAGLAPYWSSRVAMVSSDWNLQVDQIDDQGRAYMWGNNFAAFRHDMLNPTRPPEYNFMVSGDELDSFTLTTFFGAPVRQETCGEYDILIFDPPIRPEGIDDRPEDSLGWNFRPN